jgi:hypothetical protein
MSLELLWGRAIVKARELLLFLVLIDISKFSDNSSKKNDNHWFDSVWSNRLFIKTDKSIDKHLELAQHILISLVNVIHKLICESLSQPAHNRPQLRDGEHSSR